MKKKATHKVNMIILVDWSIEIIFYVVILLLFFTSCADFNDF